MRSIDLFQIWPYVALTIFGGGLLGRYARCARRENARRREGGATSTGAAAGAAADAFTLFGARRVWRWSWLLLLGVHLLGLAFPTTLLTWNADPVRLYLLEGATLLVGLASFGGWASALGHQFGGRNISKPGALADSAFLSVLLLGAASGLLSAISYRWASSWGAATLTPYVRSVLGGRPRAELIAQLPFLPRLHVAAAFAGLALFPFTRLAPALLVPVHLGLTLAARPIAWTAAGIEQWFRIHNPSALIWPEEDAVGPPLAARRAAASRRADGARDRAPSPGANVIVPDAGPLPRTPVRPGQ